jgi:tetratricopeptide (TPR) repeat protein
MVSRLLPCVVAALLLTISPIPASHAQPSCDTPAGRIVSAQGRVTVRSADGGRVRPAKRLAEVCQGDAISAGFRSRAAVSLVNGSVLRVDQRSSVQVEEISAREEASSLLRLFSGVVQFFSRKPRQYEVKTTTSTIGIRGTEFVLRADDTATEVTVLEGDVVAANNVAQVSVGSGESTRLTADATPQVRTLVRPRDQVQWSLYYPPALALSADTFALDSAAADEPLQQALGCARQGDSECAFDRLDGVPAASQGSGFRLLRAALLLSVGRVDEAGEDIGRIPATDPRAGEALALRAVVAVVQQRVQDALRDAERAVSLSPTAAAPKIALSYALQADLQLEAARDILLDATADQPDDALAWSRLAELWLMLGHRRESLSAAQRAAELQPELARTNTVLGFAALARIDTTEARAAFERALERDTSDPLPHLGLGMALIRDGELANGRGEIEAAVALNSNDALLRPYLGRAYFEERRAPLDAEQYAIAKQLDPLDPTAYLFDAIRLQSENRPVEALDELRTSIANNDNRAVYRGRLALDKDRAARGTSLARVFEDLGFTQLGLNEARRSLNLDPGNASAHRFQSDSYSSVRRREISRVSELLQSQMLQDININPVQPSQSSSNINIATRGGPTDVGFNEFSSLFERDEVRIGATALAGNNETVGGEAVLSGIYGKLSYSLGGLHYETDGWRDNNAQEQDIGNLFLQYAATPEVNVQAELSDRSSTEGDLAFNFDPDAFDDSKEVDRDLTSARAGLRVSPSPNTDILVSIIDVDRETALFERAGAIDVTVEEDGTQSEAQYIGTYRSFNLVAGAGFSEADRSQQGGTGRISELEHQRAYVYGNAHLGPAVTATAGVSFDDFQDGPLDETTTNPKLGLQWQIDDRHRVRAAAFSTVKPALLNNRTLEPTQVAGFNQFFDDLNATESTSAGLGYDSQLSETVAWGVELTGREMEEPVIVNNQSEFEDRDEQLHRLYLYATPTPTLALGVEAIYDLYNADEGVATQFDDVPTRVETVSLPLSARYFAPGGWFAGLTATPVEQEVEYDDFSSLEGGDESFFVLDLAAGYRLPARRGVISLDIRNLTDEEFSYQDDSFREFRDEPSIGPYFPEITGVLSATVVF